MLALMLAFGRHATWKRMRVTDKEDDMSLGDVTINFTINFTLTDLQPLLILGLAASIARRGSW
jgi:hypothetical protein